MLCVDICATGHLRETDPPGARGETGSVATGEGKVVGVLFDWRLVGVSTTTYGDVLFREGAIDKYLYV